MEIVADASNATFLLPDYEVKKSLATNSFSAFQRMIEGSETMENVKKITGNITKTAIAYVMSSDEST